MAFSAVTIAIAVSSLMLLSPDILRSLGAAGLAVVVIALATALTLVFAVGLIGRMPFWMAAALFIFVFILAFEWRPGIPPRELARDTAWAAGIAVAASWAATLLFERVFLIRLP